MNQSMTVFARLLLSATLSFLLIQPGFTEPPNLSLVRNEVRAYYESGRYQHELTRRIQIARQFILSKVLSNQKNKIHQKLALVLDIDETSLSNYPKMVKRDFMGSPKIVHNEIMAADAPPLKPTLALYQEALNHGVKIFFVTGRMESERLSTQKNLKKAGYSQWAGLYLRPNQYPYQSIVPFKSQTRSLIEKKGYTIIASIGDQDSDIKGGYAEKGFKLPNPFYYLP